MHIRGKGGKATASAGHHAQEQCGELPPERLDDDGGEEEEALRIAEKEERQRAEEEEEARQLQDERASAPAETELVDWDGYREDDPAAKTIAAADSQNRERRNPDMGLSPG
jgi:hypothetical protein